VGVGVVLAGTVVPVLAGRLIGCKFLQPGFVIVVETTSVNVDQIYTKIG
jgi:hypothetical protein